MQVVIPVHQAKNLVAGQIWANYSLLKHIASCENWGDPNKEPREFLPDGTVLRGYPNPNDVGLAQINVPTWGATAKQLGFDLDTYQGNLDMAEWIFDHYGSAPLEIFGRMLGPTLVLNCPLTTFHSIQCRKKLGRMHGFCQDRELKTLLRSTVEERPR